MSGISKVIGRALLLIGAISVVYGGYWYVSATPVAYSMMLGAVLVGFGIIVSGLAAVILR